MHLRLEPNSGVPLGTQIVRQLKLAIAKGRLGPGERLPSARDLAAELRVNFHTVRKAFGDLEREGLLETARGRGTFVAERPQRFAAADLRKVVREHVERLLEDLAGADVSAERLAEIVLKELEQLRARRQR